MQTDAAAKPYATALLEIAAENNKVDAYADALNRFVTAFEQCEDLRIVLTNPGLARAKRHEVLDAVLTKINVEKVIANFLHLLIDRGRIGVLSHIRRAFQNKADEAAGRVRGTAASTIQLNKMQLKKLETAVGKIVGQDVILEAVVDERLIGGLKVDVAGRVFDNSVRGQLDRIRETLSV